MLWLRVQIKVAILFFCLERLFASRASGALALHTVVMAWAGPEVCLLQPRLPAGPGAAIVLKHCLRSASKPFSHPHAPRLPHLPATRGHPCSAVSVLHPCPTRGMAWGWSAWELQDGMPSGDKDKCHGWCFSLEAGGGPRWDRSSEMSGDVCRKQGSSSSYHPPATWAWLQRSRNSRHGKWRLRGLDNNIIFKYRKFVTERKKELSGTAQKQTQAEQGYHFSGKKTDCIRMSEPIQAIKGLWHRASGIMFFVRSLE